MKDRKQQTEEFAIKGLAILVSVLIVLGVLISMMR